MGFLKSKIQSCIKVDTEITILA